MTPTTRTELMDIAKQAVEYIGRLNGEGETFQIDGDTLTKTTRRPPNGSQSK